MPALTIQEPKVNLATKQVTSSYPVLGRSYSTKPNEILYSSELARTGKSYYDTKADLPEGIRLSTASEELALQLALERTGQDPRKAEVFNDLFARNPEKVYIWQWTETGLRVPEGCRPDKYETDSKGRK